MDARRVALVWSYHSDAYRARFFTDARPMWPEHSDIGTTRKSWFCLAFPERPDFVLSGRISEILRYSQDILRYHRWFLATQKIDTVVRENLSINFGSDISVALASQRKILQHVAMKGHKDTPTWRHILEMKLRRMATGYRPPQLPTFSNPRQHSVTLCYQDLQKMKNALVLSDLVRTL